MAIMLPHYSHYLFYSINIYFSYFLSSLVLLLGKRLVGGLCTLVAGKARIYVVQSLFVINLEVIQILFQSVTIK